MNDLWLFKGMLQTNRLKQSGVQSRLRRVSTVSGMLFVTLAVWCSSAAAAEELDDLSSRMGISQISAGLKQANPAVLGSLPVKGYREGLAGFLRQYHLVPNPAQSFTSCDDDVLVTPSGGKPGCVVSIKLARKNPDGSFRDTGVRIEYGVAPGSKVFHANNSAYAEHAISGDGLLQAQFDAN